jgi:5-methylthioribose kinase
MEIAGWCFNVANTYWQIWVCFEIHFAVVWKAHKNNKIFNQNEPQNISFERVAEDSTK